jgi:hypothetical protein
MRGPRPAAAFDARDALRISRRGNAGAVGATDSVAVARTTLAARHIAVKRTLSYRRSHPGDGVVT